MAVKKRDISFKQSLKLYFFLPEQENYQSDY